VLRCTPGPLGRSPSGGAARPAGPSQLTGRVPGPGAPGTGAVTTPSCAGSVSAVAVPISPAVAARQSGKPIRAKTCPDCGTVNELDAKFCPMCGHRFSTDFSKAPATTPAKPAAPGEPPFVQMPSTGTVLVNPPPPPIILPPLPKPSTTPKPPTPLPASSSAAAPSPDPDPAANADDDLDGAPAPDLTDVDLDRLRRRNRRF